MKRNGVNGLKRLLTILCLASLLTGPLAVLAEEGTVSVEQLTASEPIESRDLLESDTTETRVVKEDAVSDISSETATTTTTTTSTSTTTTTTTEAVTEETTMVTEPATTTSSVSEAPVVPSVRQVKVSKPDKSATPKKATAPKKPATPKKKANPKDKVTSNKKIKGYKQFIKSKTASIYGNYYVAGAKKKTTTKNLYQQVVTPDKEVKNGHGTWKQIKYKEKGKTQTGWIKSTDLVDSINHSKKTKEMTLTSASAVLHKKAYVPGVKNSGKTTGMAKKKVKVTETAKTAYGTYNKITYKKSNKTYTGWVNSGYCKEIPKPKPKPKPKPAAFTYVGNKSSKVFHKSTCASAKRIAAKNKVKLSSSKDAKNKKYKPCKVCKP